MMHLIRFAALAITLVPAFYQTEYNKNPDDYSYTDANSEEYSDTDVNSDDYDYTDTNFYDNLDGCWEDINGNLLYFDTEALRYQYCTWYGRTGVGDMNEYAGEAWLWYEDSNYDLIPKGSGFTLKQDGSAGSGAQNGVHFEKSSREFPDISLETLDGIWQNASGETLVIDTSRQEFLYYSEKAADWGTMFNDEDGCGWYLFWDRDSFPCISEDGNSFIFSFKVRETEDGTEESYNSLNGVFYRDGDVDIYADLKNAYFYEEDSHVWYDDGVTRFALPEDYTIRDDGLAYDKDGRVFASAQNWKSYDPSVDWGDGWAELWYDSES